MDSLDEIIKAYMLIHGHDNNLKLLNLDDNLISFVVKLADIDFSKGNKSLKMLLSERKAISDAKNFMEHYFKLHKVLYANDSDLKKLNGRLIMSIDGLLRLYNKMGKLVNPFDIPVKFVDKDAFYGNLILQTSLSDDEYFLQRMKLFFKEVELGCECSDITSVCYVHEITHMQLESNKGIVINYYNSEILSIFLELVYAISNDRTNELFFKLKVNRINYLLFEFNRLFKYYYENDNSINKYDALVSTKYLISTFKAFNLFYLYYYGSNMVRKEILKSIQNVFDGEMFLEDLLARFDINYENSVNNELIKQLIKV